MDNNTPGLVPAGYRLPINVSVAPGLALLLDPANRQFFRDLAVDMSKASSLVAPHLLGQPALCYAVIEMALNWGLSPYAVARGIYQTPGGRIGFEGKLVAGILEKSGQFEGPISYELFGEWEKVRGKFKLAKSEKGREYPVQDWKPEDEAGLGVIVRGKMRNEIEPREFTMYLREAFPRNSTLWALRPEQQIRYAAVRAFANIACPAVLLGFASDDDGNSMVDVTPPRPRREEFNKPADAPVEDIEEPPTEFGFPEARELGMEWRNQNRPMSPPAELASEWHEAFLDGWRARDDELRVRK